jgi:phosphate transport system permease protein
MSISDKQENRVISASDLRGKARISEFIIQNFLLLCGLISILITAGIVFELGKESLLFFGRQQWEDSNKTLIQTIGPDDVGIDLDSAGGDLEVGDLIRIDQELLLVLALTNDRIQVERGAQQTPTTAHSQGAAIELANQVSLKEFLTGTDWNPQIGKFGIWALANATLMTSFTAILVALPLGLATAIYLSEYASQKARSTLKPILEVLAGVPTVVYGYFALTFMTPLLRTIFGFERVQIYNTASAGIVIGILILPLVSSMSEDALSAVPRALREAAYGLGATRLETAIRVVLPAAMSGIVAAFIIAISRAIGETMIVAIAAGAGPAFTFNPFESAETMTGHIVRISGGDLSYDSLDYNSIFAIGFMLFLMTLTLNIFSQRFVRRFREVYD